MVKAVSWCRGEQRSPAFVHLHDFIKNKPHHFDVGTSRAPSPTHLCLQFVRRKIALLFAVFTLYMDIEKRCRVFYSDTALFYYLVCVSSFSFLHRLVGLRRMRLCLILRQGFALYPQGTLSLDPASPLTPGLILRFISRYALCWGHNSGQLCSFLTPHL